ncbi:MAG: hypothetical protein R2856_13860 [Caldilineaceae bacterium]
MIEAEIPYAFGEQRLLYPSDHVEAGVKIVRLPTWTQSSFAALRRILPAQKIGRAVDVICGIDSHNDTPDTRRIHHLLGMAIGSAIFICSSLPTTINARFARLTSTCW